MSESGRAPSGSALSHALVTASFWTVNPRVMIPVRVSLGVPKTLSYEVVDFPSVYPYGLLGLDDRAEFEARYRARLEARRDRILRDLEVIRESYLGWTVCLTCWESLTKEGSWCHRTTLGQVLSEWTGEEIPEIGGA